MYIKKKTLTLIIVDLCLTYLFNSCILTATQIGINMELENNKQNIFYEKIGSGRNKILLIHGYGASRKSYYDIVPLFGDSFELYLIDLVGFGASKPNINFEYTSQNQARAVYDFIIENKLNRLCVIGHSYGGSVAIILQQLFQESNLNVLNKLILLDPAAYPQEFPFFIDLPRTPILNRFFMWIAPADFQARFVLERIFWDASKVTDERVERYAEYYSQDYNKEALIGTAKNIIPKNFNEIKEKIKKIETPTLIIWGTKDRVIPKVNIIRLHNELLNSKLVFIEDVGHVVHEEKPVETYNEIIEFLNGIRK